MKLESALEHLLPRYMIRLQVRPGNGLSRNMNVSLRSYSEIPLIIRRSVACLAHMEYLFGFTGVGVHYTDLYQILVNTHEDWHLEVPIFPSPAGAGPVVFVRKPRVPIHRFAAAWTVARRIKLLTGRGAIRLHSEPLGALRQLVTLRQGGDP